MPRFDEGEFAENARRKNDFRDRTVPDDFDMPSIDGFDLRPPRPSHEINQDIESFSQTPHRTQRKKKKRSFGKKSTKLIAVLLAVLLVFFCTFGATLGRITYDKKRPNQYVSSSDLAHSSSVKNILLLGVDARNPEDDTKSRSDSMMLISIDSKNGCIKMVSFLRDTWVYIPAKDGKQRLNAACSVDGYNGVVDTIEYNFGVDIDSYVVADFEMFKVLVDGVGGVEVDVSEKEAKEVTNHPKRYGNVILSSGKQKLTGEQALAYCRIRKIDSDFMRAYRQRIVMQTILKGIKKANPLKLLFMAIKCTPYIQTNMSKLNIITTGLKALPQIRGDMCETRVPFDKTWNYSNIGGASVITIDVEKNKEMLIDYIYDKTPEQIKAEEKN